MDAVCGAAGTARATGATSKEVLSSVF